MKFNFAVTVTLTLVQFQGPQLLNADSQCHGFGGIPVLVCSEMCLLHHFSSTATTQMSTSWNADFVSCFFAPSAI